MCVCVVSGAAVKCYVCNTGELYEGYRCNSGTLDETLLKDCDIEGANEHKNYTMCRTFIQNGQFVNSCIAANF